MLFARNAPASGPQGCFFAEMPIEKVGNEIRRPLISPCISDIISFKEEEGVRE